jgi:hypothetical protein
LSNSFGSEIVGTFGSLSGVAAGVLSMLLDVDAIPNDGLTYDTCQEDEKSSEEVRFEAGITSEERKFRTEVK